MRNAFTSCLCIIMTLTEASAQPCPEAGHDTIIQVYPSYFSGSGLIALLGGDEGGSWAPPFHHGNNALYTPCLDGEGEFTYIQNSPGCPADSATLTIQWLWNPCPWKVEEVCHTGTGICITIPPFPGEHPDVQYELSIWHIWDGCVTDFGFFSLDERVVVESELDFEIGECTPLCFYIGALFYDLPSPPFGFVTSYILGWERVVDGVFLEGIWCANEGYLNDVDPCIGTCIPTGIDEKSSVDEIRIFPNPASDIVHFAWTSDDVPLSIGASILDAMGQQWLSLSSIEQPVRVDHLPSGVYYVRFEGLKNGRLLKFLKI